MKRILVFAIFAVFFGVAAGNPSNFGAAGANSNLVAGANGANFAGANGGAVGANSNLPSGAIFLASATQIKQNINQNPAQPQNHAASQAAQPRQNRALQAARDIVGDEVFEKNRETLEEIFANERAFLDAQGGLDFTKIIPPLASRSLIIFNFSKVWESKMRFNAEAAPMLLIYVINAALGELEFGEALPSAWKNSQGRASYELVIQSEFMLSPAALCTELARYGVRVTGVRRLAQTSFEYELDFAQARLAGEPYQAGVKYAIDIPMRAYLFDVGGRASVEVQARVGSRWTPHVSFFDADLNLISQQRFERERGYLNLNVPSGARYLWLSDTFSLQNIRRGIDVTIK